MIKKRITKRNVKIPSENEHSIESLMIKRNKILVFRKWGGIGDIINTRPLFKSIKDSCPGFHVTYAVPEKYHQILDDHPFIDKLIDCDEVDLNDYGYKVDISTDCGKYETFMSPFVDKHRSDIWAENSLGIKLNDHDFRLSLDEELREKMRLDLFGKYGYDGDPKIVVFPRSASTSKDLIDETLFQFIEILKDKEYNSCVIDSAERVANLNIPLISDLSMREFVHMLSIFDYVISVDTGPFHVAAALKIPTVGIFGWTDGKILSSYHPKVEIVQRHRDNREDHPWAASCPCWNWPVCVHKVRGKPTIPLKCMESLNAEEIYQAFTELVSKYPTKEKAYNL